MGSKKEVEVTFRTITPLWTGDAWGKDREVRPSSRPSSLYREISREIRPSSLLGSLRFWFEVICYFSGICSESDFNKRSRRFEKEIDKKKLKDCLLKKGSSFEAKVECLKEQKIPLPSIVFGTTNWRSLIEIKDIEKDIKHLEDYCFGNKLNLPYAIAFYKKDLSKKEDNNEPIKFSTKEELNKFINNKYRNIKNWQEKRKKFREDYTIFFFPAPYSYGKFSVIFKVEREILESIFFPLLTFMEQYGYWGGKWNLGYGRLKIEKIKEINEWRKEEFDLTMLCKDMKLNFEKFTKFGESFEDLMTIDKKIKFVEDFSSDSSDLRKLIISLIKEKAQKRAGFREDTEKRHKLFGKTGNPKKLPYVPQGSKILPYIYKEGNSSKAGFLSIAGLLKLKKKGE